MPMILNAFKKERTFIENVEKGTVSIERGSEIENQLKIIQLTPEELGLMKAMQPLIFKNIDGLVDVFYRNLSIEPSLIQIINKFSSIEKLKKTLHTHIVEMFTGVIDKAYIDKRIRIARVHVKIGLESKWYMSAFQGLLYAIIQIIAEEVKSKEEAYQCISVVTKTLSLEQQLVLEAYDEEVRRLKARTEEHKREAAEKISVSANELVGVSCDTSQSFRELIERTDEIVGLTNIGQQLSEKLGGKAEEGMGQLHKETSTFNGITDSASLISKDVHSLIGTLEQVKSIVSIVTAISEQTNLLSLNAAIEAARAGEHGKSFAVVASEVRKLSDETKKSADNVSNLLADTNTHVNALEQSLSTINEVVERVSEGMKNVIHTFEQIIDVVAQSKEQNSKINDETIEFAEQIKAISKSADKVEEYAEKLKEVSYELAE